MKIEPAYADAEATLGTSGSTKTTLSPEQIQWVDAFYRNVQGRMLNLYDGARLESSTIYDRERVASHWRDKLEWFSGQLTFNAQTKANLEALQAPIPETLSDAIKSLTEIVEACEAHYELHA